MFDVCCDRHDLGFDFCAVNFGAKVDQPRGRGGLRSTKPPPRQVGTGGTVSKIEFGCGILNFGISARGTAYPVLAWQGFGLSERR